MATKKTATKKTRKRSGSGAVPKPDGILKAVVFDWAGTTVDYGSLAPAAAMKETFEEYRITVTDEQIRRTMGLEKKEHTRTILQLPEIQEQWKVIYGVVPDEEILNTVYTRLEPLLVEIVGHYADPVPGTIDLLAELRRRGIKVGSTTGYTSPVMERLVPEARKRGFDPDAVVNSSQVPAGRPAPWMCFLNARKLDVYPMRQMIKIGDTAADILEGRNAGMWTVGVVRSGNALGLSERQQAEMSLDELTRLTRSAGESLRASGAHFVVDGLWDCLGVLNEIEGRLRAGDAPYGGGDGNGNGR